jgi:hypothetical protein
VAQLCQYQNEFQQRNTRVIIISFGTLPAVQQWLSETCVSFTVLLDRERSIYNAYGLESSYWRSYNPKTLWFYFKAWVSGKKINDSHGDDTSQLGGDFIVNEEGILTLAYPSHDPTDRPLADALLAILPVLEK